MNNDKINQVINNIKRSWEDPEPFENMETSEKMISIGAGAFIFLKGIGNLLSHPIIAVTEVAIGGGLLYRGLTGYCPVKDITHQNSGDTIIVRETFITDPGPLG